MLGFIKKVFFTGLTILSSVNLLAAAIILAPYGQKTLYWQLSKVILSGMFNCNFEAIN